MSVHWRFLLLVVALSGCAPPPAAQFRLNTEGRNANAIAELQAEAISDALKELFGSPDEPRVPEQVSLRLDWLQRAAGPIRGDADGTQWGLFRRHCAACHGISGDGAGPSAAVLTPYPRDFRHGVFKYTSTAGGAKPTRDDLRRTLLRGVPGTAMPSFRKLTELERESLVDYVKYLAVRGQTELYLLEAVLDEDAPLPLDLDQVLDEAVGPAARSWNEAPAMSVVPPPSPPTDAPELLAASIERGDRLFHGTRAQCVKCHGPLGNGHGEQSELYDDWNKPKLGTTPDESRELARRFRLPIQRIFPRDFTLGQFRGGDRPIDQYWRIHVGIKGTPMPASGPSSGSSGTLTPQQIWDVVNYVRQLQ